MEIWHFFVIFHDFVMKCVYKSTIYTFVIRDKIWTPPFVVQKCTCYFCVLGPENTPPPPCMSGTFVLAPPPPPGPLHWPMSSLLTHERRHTGYLL